MARDSAATVLVVDDDTEMLASLRRVILRHDLEVLTASDGQ